VSHFITGSSDRAAENILANHSHMIIAALKLGLIIRDLRLFRRQPARVNGPKKFFLKFFENMSMALRNDFRLPTL